MGEPEPTLHEGRKMCSRSGWCCVPSSMYRDLFEDMHAGRFFEAPTAGNVVDVARLLGKEARAAAAKALPDVVAPPAREPPAMSCPADLS